METKYTCLVLADISGYTRFVKFHTTSALHAEHIISELLETVINAAEFPLQVVKLEGDAVLLAAECQPAEAAVAARSVAGQIEKLFVAFRQRERALIACDNGCVCEACRNIGELKLKAILNYGQVVVRRLDALEELGGREVNLTRILLKNTIPAQEYVVMTETFQRLSGGLPGQTPEMRLEDGGEAGQVPVAVFYPTVADGTNASFEPTSAPAFSGRLNQHAFARMLMGKSRATFNHLPEGSNNLILYLGEGIFSGLNVLKRLGRK